MLHKRKADFSAMVWASAARVGLNASKITDDILREAFPRTWAEAEIEGAEKPLRDGVLIDVRRIIRQAPPCSAQRDFAEIAPQFMSHVAALKSATYFVEALGLHVSVADLIGEPELLDDARRFMRRKGEECIAEAERLDQLYAAVTEAA